MQALVIDDSRTMRRILARTLRVYDFEIREAGDGQAALDSIERDGLPDLALVDWNMPVMNGLEFIVALRQLPGGRSVTTMMVTTESEHSQVVRALAAGAHEYLLKPFTPEALSDKLLMMGMLPTQSAHQ